MSVDTGSNAGTRPVDTEKKYRPAWRRLWRDPQIERVTKALYGPHDLGLIMRVEVRRQGTDVPLLSHDLDLKGAAAWIFRAPLGQEFFEVVAGKPYKISGIEVRVDWGPA